MRIFFLIFTTTMILFFFVGCGPESDLKKERKIDLIPQDSLKSVDVSALKSRSIEIKLESSFNNPSPSNEYIAINNNQYERIKNILELNVIKHFELENKLDTDLKRKLFKSLEKTYSQKVLKNYLKDMLKLNLHFPM